MLNRTQIALGVLTVVVVSGLAAVWWISGRGFSALDEPSGVEALVARRVRALATPREAKEARNPVAQTAEVLSKATAHFADHCAVCHGNDGSGETPFGKGMYPKPPDMRQSTTQDLTDGELVYIIHNGIRFTGMPAFGQEGSEPATDSWELVHFIRHLPNLTDAELEQMKTLNPKSPTELQQQDEFERFLRGEDVVPAPHVH
jgi:mono/diheme cytochrome c family protein